MRHDEYSDMKIAVGRIHNEQHHDRYRTVTRILLLKRNPSTIHDVARLTFFNLMRHCNTVTSVEKGFYYSLLPTVGRLGRHVCRPLRERTLADVI